MSTEDLAPPIVWLHYADGGASTAINITTPLPRIFQSAPDWEEASRTIYRAQGKQLAQALAKALPGGTLDALLIELLTDRASLLRVPLRSRSMPWCPDGRHCTTTEHVCAIDLANGDHIKVCCDCKAPL